MKSSDDLTAKGRETPRNPKTMEGEGSNAWVSLLRAVPFRDVSRPFAVKWFAAFRSMFERLVGFEPTSSSFVMSRSLVPVRIRKSR